ncbi:MAG: FTR1 family protein, partial [Gammaproteobacteria bacterium]
MLSTAIILFREVLEAALIVGIVLTVTKGIAGRSRWVGYGVGAGLLGACIVAVFAEGIAQAAEGMGQEFFNAGVLLAATGMLAWHNLWMARHGRELATRMKTIGRDVADNAQPLHVLTVVIALAVLREGAEVVLFVYGIAAGGATALPMLSGGVLGIIAGVAVGGALYFGLVRIPTKYLFTVTAWLIVLLAAGMASQATGYLIQAGTIPAIKPVLWDTSAILSEHSLIGEMLHTLVGYDERPAAMQFLVYAGAIMIIGAMTLAANKPARQGITSVATAIALTMTIVATTLISQPAQASHKVYYPTVEPGETELELRGHVTADSDD